MWGPDLARQGRCRTRQTQLTHDFLSGGGTKRLLGWKIMKASLSIAGIKLPLIRKLGIGQKFTFTCSFSCTSWPDIKPWILLKLEMVVLTFHLEEAVALLGWTIKCLMIVVILSFLHTSLWMAVFWSYLPQYRWKFGQRMCSRATSLQAWGRKWRDGRGQRESLKQFLFSQEFASFYLVKIVSLHHLVGSHHLWAG